MKLLRTLTLAYFAILVPTLAASLIAILVYLRRIGGTLARVESALATVRRETEPLNPGLAGLNDAVGRLADQVVGVRERLAHAPDRFAAIVAADRGPGRD